MSTRPSLLEWARRHAESQTSSVVSDLQAGLNPEEVAARQGFPEATVVGIRAFFDHLRAPHTEQVCRGSSCRFAGSPPRDTVGLGPVYCLGRCYEAPCDTRSAPAPIPRVSLVDPPALLSRSLSGPCLEPGEAYQLPGAETILAAISEAGLRGRGGAAFPTAVKWSAARDAAGSPKYVVANGDEGDPSVFVDRLLLEEDPHAVLSGMLACARVVGASEGIVFIRDEYPRAHKVMAEAIAVARSAGHLDGFEVRVVRGAGSYLAGEETAMLRCIEGLRAEPSPKPPYPAESGLWGRPTVVQNIETLAAASWLARGGAWSGSKVFCLTGAINRPGLVEAPLGLTVRELLEQGAGGAPSGARWKMALLGGPIGCVVPATDFDRRLTFEETPGLGHGGILVLDDTVSARELAEHLFELAAAESCGSCTPCRVGSAQLARCTEREPFERLLTTMKMGSLCGFGTGVPGPLRDLLAHFPAEMFPC